VKRAILLLALTGCQGYLSFETIVPPACASRYAETVTACAQAGNPLSDEEGEDLVRQCQDAAGDSWGAQRPRIWSDHGQQECDERCDAPRRDFEERTAALIAVCSAAGEP
jgi:hypothetical protein